MSVVKFVEISSSSKVSIEDAVKLGLSKTAKTLQNIQGAWINETKVKTSPKGEVTEWRVNMRISFIVD